MVGNIQYNSMWNLSTSIRSYSTSEIALLCEKISLVEISRHRFSYWSFSPIHYDHRIFVIWSMISFSLFSWRRLSAGSLFLSLQSIRIECCFRLSVVNLSKIRKTKSIYDGLSYLTLPICVIFIYILWCWVINLRKTRSLSIIECFRLAFVIIFKWLKNGVLSINLFVWFAENQSHDQPIVFIVRSISMRKRTLFQRFIFFDEYCCLLLIFIF